MKTIIKLKITKHIQFFRYFFVGGCAALAEWITFALCVKVLGIHYLLAVVVAFFIATMLNYILSIVFVFSRGRHTASTEMMLVFLVSGIGLGINATLMWLLHGKMGSPALPTKIGTTGLVFLWNYFSRKTFIFSKNTPTRSITIITEGGISALTNCKKSRKGDVSVKT